MRNLSALRTLLLALLIAVGVLAPRAEENARKVLLVGDSMAGWLGERLAAYGAQNGFEVSTVIWDGSTIKKWSDSKGFRNILAKENPDAVMICLGMNDLFRPNPEKSYGTALNHILEAVGDRPLLWIGPPSWPGTKHTDTLTPWLSKRLGPKKYFQSKTLNLQRQSKTNPHPTKAASSAWMDEIVKWIPAHSEISFKSLEKPSGKQMTRGKTYIYKRMKETF